MVGESNHYEFLIQIDASRFAEFEISEFEIWRVDCSTKSKCYFMYTAVHSLLQYRIVSFSGHICRAVCDAGMFLFTISIKCAI